MLTQLKQYGRNNGPGWIQAAVTLGGGSLVSSLYLGVIGGFEYLWLQPLAMFCGVIMLSVISYVTLSKPDFKDRPFRLIKRSISPTLAWGWLGATVIANIVFCSSQFALATDTIQINIGLNIDSYVITAFIFVFVFGFTWLSQYFERASRLIDLILKVLVSVIVISFIIVAVKTLVLNEISPWVIMSGLIPDLSMLFSPVESFMPFLEKCGDDRGFWEDYIISSQRDIIIGAFGTAVGINMTFLLPYTLISKGWGRAQRHLARIDLIFGLFIPFLLSTVCLVMVAATQFHGRTDNPVNQAAYLNVLDAKLSYDHDDFKVSPIEQQKAYRAAAAEWDKEMSSLLAKRNTRDLSSTLEPILGNWSLYLFGIGVLAMAISTILVHMMMNGYAIGEALGDPRNKRLYLYGAAIPALLGLCSPILWQGAIKTALVIPASVVATIFLPIAYIAFMILINDKSTMKEDLPRRRVLVNVLMFLTGGVATFASLWAIFGKLESPLYYERFIAGFGLIIFISVLLISLNKVVNLDQS